MMVPLRDAAVARSVGVSPRSFTTRRPARTAVSRTYAKAGTHYDLLGVDRGASEDDIKAAFRRKAKELHPDVNKDEDAGQQFQAVNQAYEVLSDPSARASYDRQLQAAAPMSNFFRDVNPDDNGVEQDYESWRRQRARQERQWAAGEPAGADRGQAPWEDGEHDSEALRNPYEFMRNLSRYMSGSGAGPRVAVHGDSATAQWRQRVEQQLQGRSGRPGSWQGAGRGGSDDPFAPGAPEWSPRWRRGQEEDEEDGGGGLEWKPPGLGRDRNRFGLGGKGKPGWPGGGGGGTGGGSGLPRRGGF